MAQSINLVATTEGWCPRTEIIKPFFMLNLAAHEISNAHKYKNIKKFSCFVGSDKHRMLFFLLINVYKQEKIHAQLS